MTQQLKAAQKYGWLYLMALPGMTFFILFHYVPMWGALMAFQDYSPFLGFWKSPWVGFEHFRRFFGNDEFFILLRNTLLLSLYNLTVYFPVVIALAILMSELRSAIYRRIVQTVLYLPHFISWVIIAGVTIMFFGPSGVINHALDRLSTEIPFLVSDQWFRPLMVFQSVWKDAGWGTIIFLAALSGIHPELYEAATMDGAGRLRRIWSISLPGIRSTVVILILLHLGRSLDSNFMQIFVMSNNLNLDVSDVFDLYVYRQGLIGAEFSFGTAVGLFKSLASLTLVVIANRIAKALGEDGVF